MATLSPMAMTSVMRLSGSFALRGLARAGAAAAQRSKGAMASSSAMATSNASSMTPSLHRLFASLLALPGTALCYSGVTFVPVTASDPEYSFKDYDVDALLASQQRPLAGPVLFRTFWKYYLLHEALHANTYFSEIDRLEQEEFERGGGPLEKWPPYFSGAREWSSLLGTVSRATARETAVKLVRLALARFSCSLCDDLSSQRSAFKLLKDAGKSAARKKELAKEAAAEALSLVSSTSGSSFAERLSARSVARWQRGPALALSAGATAFRSGLLFALADFIVSATTETVKALIEAAREARGIGASSEGEEREGERLAVVGRGESGGDSILAFSWLRSSSLSLARSLSEIVGAFFGVSLSTTKTTINPALTALLRSSAVSLAYASAAPSLIRSGAALVANPTSADFVLAGVASGALALAASTGALRAALGRQRAAALRAAVSRAAVRCSVGLSATSLAYGAAVAVGLPGWTWPGVQLAADNAAHAFLVGPALQEQAECGKVSEGRAVAVGAALAAGCVAAVGVL